MEIRASRQQQTLAAAEAEPGTPAADNAYATASRWVWSSMYDVQVDTVDEQYPATPANTDASLKKPRSRLRTLASTLSRRSSAKRLDKTELTLRLSEMEREMEALNLRAEADRERAEAERERAYGLAAEVTHAT
jgi:hypothetical protein